MTRLFLATALVLHISGVAGVAAFVCAQPEMTAQTCCCHQERSDADSSGAPEASAPCPCAMSPGLPAPVSQTPVTVSTSYNPLSAPAIVTPVVFDAAASSNTLGHLTLADTSPPPVSLSPLRC